jgi:dipeptidyl aminopeptidase/acylaminoacyl peptidase
VQGVIAFYPITDMLSDEFSPDAIAALEDYLGVSRPEALSAWEAASPLSWVDGSEAPFLILHGTDDTIVPASQSVALAEALAAADVPVQLVLLPQASHDFMLRVGSEEEEMARAAVIDFLARPRNQDEENVE